MAECAKEELLAKLKNASAISLATGESTDITDITQIAISLRFFDEREHNFYEELLPLLPLYGSTTGEDIFNGLKLMGFQ